MLLCGRTDNLILIAITDRGRYIPRERRDMIRYKINVLEALKQKGYSTYKIHQDNLLSQSSLTKLRRGDAVNMATLDKICLLLDCQPGDVIEMVEDSNNG